MVPELSLQLGDSAGQFLVPGKHLTKLDKSSDDEDAYLNGFGGIQDAGSHDCPMFRKYVRVNGGVLELLEVVTTCYHLGLFLLRQAEHEIRRETLSIATNGLIKGFGGDAVCLGKISVDNDFLAPNQQDALLNRAHFDYAFLCHREFLAITI